MRTRAGRSVAQQRIGRPMEARGIAPRSGTCSGRAEAYFIAARTCYPTTDTARGWNRSAPIRSCLASRLPLWHDLWPFAGKWHVKRHTVPGVVNNDRINGHPVVSTDQLLCIFTEHGHHRRFG